MSELNFIFSIVVIPTEDIVVEVSIDLTASMGCLVVVAG